MERKNSFILYGEYMNYFEALDVADQAALIMALFRYHRMGETPEGMCPAAMMAFMFIRDQMDRDRAKYEKICEKNRQNGKRGGRPAETERFSEKPKKTDTDTDIENENGTDTDTGTDTEGHPTSGDRPRGEPSADVPQSGRKRKSAKKKKDHYEGSFDTDEFFEAALKRSYDYVTTLNGG